MLNGKKEKPDLAAQLQQNRGMLAQVAKTGEARRLAEMLKQSGPMEEAAQAAAQGDTAQLMGMVQKLMNDPEGAKLIQSINRQVEQSK